MQFCGNEQADGASVLLTSRKGARMKRYSQLAQEQRYQIYAFKKAGWTQKEIAMKLGVHPSTVCRELQRNTGGRGYRPQQAHQRAVSGP